MQIFFSLIDKTIFFPMRLTFNTNYIWHRQNTANVK